MIYNVKTELKRLEDQYKQSFILKKDNKLYELPDSIPCFINLFKSVTKD